MRNVAKILSIVSARCESTSACSLCADFSSNVASVDAIPCILVSALQTYHRLTVDVTHFLASTNPRLSRNSTFCNLQDIDSEQDEERPLTTVSIICLHSMYIHKVFLCIVLSVCKIWSLTLNDAGFLVNYRGGAKSFGDLQH